MSTNTKIQWADHTFNAWWGCTEVHAGCANCYAKAWDRRWGGDHWGKTSSRRMILGEWGKPAQWNEAARIAGKPATVFASSMCDVFEDFTGPVVDQQGKPVVARGCFSPLIESLLTDTREWTIPALRRRLFDIIRETPNLRWLLLTKRPENIRAMVPATWLEPGQWPAHVWTGTSPVNQETADACIPHLLRVPGKHFLSVEPMVGPIDLSAFFGGEYVALPGDRVEKSYNFGIDWIIVGGESGTGKTIRPHDINWARSIRDQCAAAGVPFFFKQAGAKPLGNQYDPFHGESIGKVAMRYRAKKGDDPAEWPEDLRVQDLPDWTLPACKAVGT